jgi:thioester reductase-like protein
MNNGKTKRGLEALAFGDVPPLPAKASSPALFIIHYSLFIIHYPLSTIMLDIDFYQEALLAPDFQFRPFSSPSQQPEALFLTGATGFLGAHLLSELLRQTPAKIYCLVRNNTGATEEQQRLKSTLQFYELWKEEFAPRIVPVVGEVSKPGLGIAKPAFSKLAERIEAIYHSAALVDFNRPYSTLKAVNVQGTYEILRLATESTTKPLHFVSSMAIFLPSQTLALNKRVMETDFPLPDTLQNGYSQSKWVAEKLLLNARERGFPVSIYRSPGIKGHSQTGITGNLNDPWCTLIKGCIQLGLFPDVDKTVNFVPVDYVSRAMIHLSLQNTSIGKTFHLVNPHPSTTWKDLFNMIRAIGYPLVEIPYEQWLAEVKQRAINNPKQELYAHLVSLIRSPLFSTQPRFDAEETRQGLIGSNIECSQVDMKLISNYFSFFHKSNYLAMPD